MSQLVEGLVKSGQHNNLMSILLEQNWEITTIAGIQMGLCLWESTVSPLTQISDGNAALFHIVIQHTTVRKDIRWVSAIREG